MEPFVLRGNFLWSDGVASLCKMPRAYSVCDEDGRCVGVFSSLPAVYQSLPVRDLGDVLIVPGYCDLHLHAAQYRNMGLGMDYELLQWLQELTYPEEAKFRNAVYAKAVYSEFVQELQSGFTTRAVIFASAHREGTEILMELLERSGLFALVGKVNMDRNAPDYIREPNDAVALADTAQWAEETVGRFQNVKPILTPRFVPSCTLALLQGLGQLRQKYHLPAQSHLDESPEEIQWVQALCPESRHYAEVYDRAGLLGPDVIMAHCIYLSPEEQALLKNRGVMIAHCPTSNVNVRSGLAPVRRYMDAGLSVGLGTDISGGQSLDMADAVRDALAVSRCLWRTEGLDHLRAEEAFYLAAAGGGAFFGKVGRFLPGYEFDAVAVDDSAWRQPEDDLDVRFQKMIYRSHSLHVTAKYVRGKRLF